MYICTHIAVEHVRICMQFIALGTFDGTIKLLDHTGTFLKDRSYAVVRKFLQFCVHVHALYSIDRKFFVIKKFSSTTFPNDKNTKYFV